MRMPMGKRMRRPLHIAVLAAAASLALAASSAGQQEYAPATVTAVSFTPPPMPSAAERMRLRDGLAAADANDWTGLAQLRDAAGDPLVRRMLQWRWAASSEAPLYFVDISTALAELQGWPGRTTMRQRAEQAIFDSTLRASERIAFLRQDGGPITGDGRIALAIALKESGQRTEATEIARAAFRVDALSPQAELRARDEFSFTAADYADRVDALLWRGQRSAAQASHD